MMRWRAASREAVHLRCWEDEFVVYNRLSGDTHLLGAAAGQILLDLQHAPADESTLTASLCRLFQADPSPNLSLQIRNILADLEKLALVEEVA